MTVEIVRAQNFAKLKFPWEMIFRMTRVVKVSAGITAGLALPAVQYYLHGTRR